MPLKPLTDEEKENTHNLLAAIERKDRRFRLLQTLFMVGTFLILIVIIGIQQRTLDNVRENQKQAEQVAVEATKRSQEQQDTILRRLDCMSVFFSQKDRTNLSIENIDKCTLNRGGDIQEFFIQKPGQEPETTREQQGSNLPDSTTSQQGVVQNSNPKDPIQDSDEVIEPRPPLTIDTPIIDIPICVPLTGLCVRS
jgi:hypothetical protein